MVLVIFKIISAEGGGGNVPMGGGFELALTIKPHVFRLSGYSDTDSSVVIWDTRNFEKPIVTLPSPHPVNNLGAVAPLTFFTLR